ncbi:MAG: hypothetical protein NC122_03455 [Faecalibacterium sp.]|nr:hypothetical protein [Ruminococcus sp.]MCM1391443.1 hypothetical protein [Ruminococcus sp.]MCM1485242.1 hypothetical protein [Faecalibacterium sp.]
MNKKAKKKNGTDPYNLGDIHDFLYDRYTVMSATECTGLIPFDPSSEAERDNYKEIYDIN